MRVLALLIAFVVAVPAWAQIEQHASGAQPGTPLACGWCIGAEIGLTVASIVAGALIGYAINSGVHDRLGIPLFAGGAAFFRAAF